MINFLRLEQKRDAKSAAAAAAERRLLVCLWAEECRVCTHPGWAELLVNRIKMHNNAIKCRIMSLWGMVMVIITVHQHSLKKGCI